MIRTISKLMAPLQRRVRLMVSRGLLTLIDDGSGVQRVQVKLRAGEVRDGLDRVQTYGLASHPPAGSEAVVLFVGGNSDHGVVIGEADRATRHRDLQPGEVALYTTAHGEGHRILLGEGRAIRLQGKDIIIEGETHTVEVSGAVSVKGASITLEAETITLKGNVESQGDFHSTGNMTVDGTSDNHHSH
jgi:phage baseplate assembly protein V